MNLNTQLRNAANNKNNDFPISDQHAGGVQAQVPYLEQMETEEAPYTQRRTFFRYLVVITCAVLGIACVTYGIVLAISDTHSNNNESLESLSPSLPLKSLPPHDSPTGGLSLHSQSPESSAPHQLQHESLSPSVGGLTPESSSPQRQLSIPYTDSPNSGARASTDTPSDHTQKQVTNGPSGASDASTSPIAQIQLSVPPSDAPQVQQPIKSRQGSHFLFSYPGCQSNCVSRLSLSPDDYSDDEKWAYEQSWYYDRNTQTICNIIKWGSECLSVVYDGGMVYDPGTGTYVPSGNYSVAAYIGSIDSRVVSQEFRIQYNSSPYGTISWFDGSSNMWRCLGRLWPGRVSGYADIDFRVCDGGLEQDWSMEL